jgi:hypothetical protein
MDATATLLKIEITLHSIVNGTVCDLIALVFLLQLNLNTRVMPKCLIGLHVTKINFKLSPLNAIKHTTKRN